MEIDGSNLNDALDHPVLATHLTLKVKVCLEHHNSITNYVIDKIYNLQISTPLFCANKFNLHLSFYKLSNCIGNSSSKSKRKFSSMIQHLPFILISAIRMSVKCYLCPYIKRSNFFSPFVLGNRGINVIFFVRCPASYIKAQYTSLRLNRSDKPMYRTL